MRVEGFFIQSVHINNKRLSETGSPMKTVLILVDVQNVYYTTRQAFNRRFDYNQFWSTVTAEGQVVKAIAYAIDRGDKKQREFQNILRAIGFEVKLKPFIQRSDGSAKGDWDVGIAIDALEYIKETLGLYSAKEALAKIKGEQP